MFIKRASLWLAICAITALLSLSAACGKKDTAENQTDNAGPSGQTYTATGKEGTISGSVALSGTAPEPKKIDMSQDSACASKNPNATSEDVVAKNGKLAFAFVYIKDGTTADGKKIGDLSFAVPTTAAVLDQNGCHYKPHVLGLMANQKLSITNSDPTTHNVHPTPKNNPEWNQTQTQGAPPIEKTFARAETLVPVKCNQHPWMKSYIGVLKHPFFAVSGEDGSYQIKGVPPGTYTVVAWHEKFGEKTQEVKVDANGTATFSPSFDATATANIENSSLKLLPAIEFPMMRHN